MMRRAFVHVGSLLTSMLFACGIAVAAEAADRESSWITVPLLSSDPKVGTSLGGMVGYMHRFDERSPASMFGLSAKYSTTHSYTAGLFAQAFFGEDRHRLLAGIGTGKIRNDYEDFLGSGLPAQTTDELRLVGLRYQRRLGGGHWFLGGQYLWTNYVIHAEDTIGTGALEILGLTGVEAGGLGLVVTFDDRDNPRSSTRGRFAELSNLAYRKALGGDEDFDVYRLKFRHYLPHGQGHVLAYRIDARITDDAPTSAYSTPNLRGYVRGNYLAPKSLTAEIEERHRLAERWSVALFAGVACLLNGITDCGSRSALFPAAGIGVVYDLKPRDGVVIRLDYAQGKDGNSGFYLSLGQPF